MLLTGFITKCGPGLFESVYELIACAICLQREGLLGPTTDLPFRFALAIKSTMKVFAQIWLSNIVVIVEINDQ